MPRVARASFPNKCNELREEIADGQQDRSPHECGAEIGELETPIRHLENTGDKRHRCPQRTEEAADEDGEHSPFAHEGLTTRDQFWVARQWPHVLYRVLEFLPDPVGQPVAERRTESGRDPNRPEVDATRADQRAD